MEERILSDVTVFDNPLLDLYTLFAVYTSSIYTYASRNNELYFEFSMSLCKRRTIFFLRFRKFGYIIERSAQIPVDITLVKKV